MVKVILAKQASKSFEKIPSRWQARIINAIESLKQDPFYGKKMWGPLEGKRNIRVWPYRIIYGFKEQTKTIFVFRINHRGSIGYK